MTKSNSTNSAKGSDTEAVDGKSTGKKTSKGVRKPKRAVKKPRGRLTKRELEGLVPDHKTFDLSLPQLRFVAAYIKNEGNVNAAGRECHPEKTKEAASSFGRRMMARDNVVDAIDSYREHWFGDLRRECRDKALKVLSARAFYDLSKVIGRDGNFLLKDNPDFNETKYAENDFEEEYDNQKKIPCDLTDVPRHLRDCIDGIEKKSAGNNGVFTTLKLASRTEAIKMLHEYMGLFDRADDGQPNLNEDTERQLKAVFDEVE